MCLYSKQILPHRATKDIVCYKAMYRDIRLSGISYISPFQKFIVPTTSFGKVYKAMGNYKNYHYDIIFTPGHRGFCRVAVITEGYFHAYKSDCDAVYAAGSLRCVIKCIIPKGALYWNGTFGDICATEMIFVQGICP